MGLSEYGRRTVHGLRLPGPDIRDAGAERQPLRRGQQHGQLDEGILATDDLVGPHGVVADAFHAPDGLALEIDGQGVVKETGRVTPTGPRARRAASITVVVPVDPMNILLGSPARLGARRCPTGDSTV